MEDAVNSLALLFCLNSSFTWLMLLLIAFRVGELAKRGLTPRAADLRHTCGDCGKELQIVRPGKYQCVNPKCGASR